jgi:hypothetical protein
MKRIHWRTVLRYVALLLVFAFVLGAKGPASCGPGGSVGAGGGAYESGWLNCHQLERLWVYAGGPVADEQVMAALGMSEGGGVDPANGKWRSNQFAYLNDGTSNDEGYWGINSDINSASQTFYPPGADREDPMVNARAAVTIFNQVGLTAWSSYNNGRYKAFCGE